MKEKMTRILDHMHRYNSDQMAMLAFGLDSSVEYDALVVAPSFTPWKLKMDEYCTVTTLKEGSYIAGYLVEKDGLKIAWIKIASSDSNLIDHIAVCAELKFRKMIFIGAVGALKPHIGLGDVCTPSFSIAGGSAHTYLTPLWAERLGKREMVAKQISRRGGILRVSLGDNRVFITGSAVLFMQGDIPFDL